MYIANTLFYAKKEIKKMALTLNNNIIKPDFTKIPQTLQELPQWTCWTSRERADKDGNIFLTKEPVDAAGRNIDWRNLNNLRAYEQVQAEYATGNFNGVGFVLKQDTPLVCVDLDNINDFDHMDASLHYLTNFTYTEISPSGNGLHLWFAGRKPVGFTGTKSGDVELFGGQDKFVTVTGAIFEEQDAPTTQIETRPEIIQHIVDTYFAKKPLVTHAGDATRGSNGLSKSDVIKLIERFKPKTWRVFNGDFSEYASQSEAVMALLNDIAFYTAKDAIMMHDVYMSSNATYADQKANSRKLYYTINKAIAGTKNSYMPKDKQPTATVDVQDIQTIPKTHDWWRTNQNGTKSFVHYELAEAVMASYSIVRYPNAQGDLYYYNARKGIYEHDKSGKVLQGIIRTFDKKNLKSLHIREVYQYIEQLCAVVSKISETHIAVGNGHLNLHTCELEPFTPHNFILQKITTNYNPHAQSKFVDQTILKVTDNYVPSIENIKEMFACVLYPKVLVPKMFYLYGRTAHNGKSSLLNMLHSTFNRDGGNISAVSPQKLATNTFAGASIYGKMANIVDDQPDQLIEDAGTLRTMITGGYIEIERKGKDSETVKIQTTMITASNYFPNFKESGKQINRRLHIIPFDHDFSTDPDRLSDSESLALISSTETAERVLKLAVDKLKQMLDSQQADKLTPNPKADMSAELFAIQNDPLNDYFDEFDAEYFDRMPGAAVIAEYEQWCTANRVMPLGNKRFKERVCTQYNMIWTQKRAFHKGENKSCKGFKKQK